ncbi:MAG: glycosyltransferase family 2 protein [Oribacterium sp.]|nr:glycosyltransferase family 2 protein [Oribacterium sp.]MBQ5330764.1 glycosyltransferase family 2 protein [Oscillospiraceae bacterium]
MVETDNKPDSLGNKKDPLISVIIPVYNVAPYLREALDSVVNQTYRHLEILVIDDGSTDESSQICDEYLFDPRIIVLHQKNCGLSNARNNGLDVATGKYIAFLDSDDAWHPSFIEELLSAIERTGSDLAVCRYSVQKTEGCLISPKKKAKKTRPLAKAGTYGRKKILNMTINGMLNRSVWNKLYRSELWKTIRFPDGHNYEDIETTLHIVDVCNNVTVIDLILYYHRVRSGSIVQTVNWKNLNDYKRAISCLEKYVRSHTPEIFNKGQVYKIRTLWLAHMMVRYTLISSGDEVQKEALRKEILSTGQKIGVKNCTLRYKAAFFMIKYCPGLFEKVILVYKLFRPWVI